MGLSSNVFWHQTTFEGLKGIIQDQCLYFSYSLETIMFNKGQISFAVPMISICDLPFSEMGCFICDTSRSSQNAKGHIGRYGDYTIAFSREWALKNKFNSVWYCEKQSQALEIIRSQIKELLNARDETEIESLRRLEHLVIGSLCYIKNFEGQLIKLGYKNYRFSDEREWRVVAKESELSSSGYKQIIYNPSISQDSLDWTAANIGAIQLSEYDKFKEKNDNSPLLKRENLSIRFEWEDVKYIIAKEQKDVMTIRSLICEKHQGNENIPIFTIEEVMTNIIGTSHNKDVCKGV